ncbi:hypothetical protein SBBP2_900003 [Burkholderiales bacterium]|nr:hypothetical protein SBBP2_900003 [Burkholderiales bacterium]
MIPASRLIVLLDPIGAMSGGV